MRFDLTCNIALRATPGCRLLVQVLPAVREQQRLLHEVMWVEGCERWAILARPCGTRILELLGCGNEVRIAFAASLTLTPVWRQAGALGERHEAGLPARPGIRAGERWSAQRIVAALGSGMRGPTAAFAALPRLFAWMRRCIETDGLWRLALEPGATTTVAATDSRKPPPCAGQHVERLEFAIAVFRALGVPARIAAGFGPVSVQDAGQDGRVFNLELYNEGRWWLFEPDGQVPACGFVCTAAGSDPGDLVLVQGPGRVLRMHADVDPPPAWGLPLRTDSRALLSLDARKAGPEAAAPSTEAGIAEATFYRGALPAEPERYRFSSSQARE
jgi:hypothetical protein